ncbi:MAG TPA: choice-of-anchor Q domain-containing protein [Micromonosporaceae bacterium]
MREFMVEQPLPAHGRLARRRRWRLVLVAIVAAVAAGSLWASGAQAATLTVTTTGDPSGTSQCSLREAIATINAFGTTTVCGTADSSGNTIVLGPHPYTLSLQPNAADANSTGDLDLTANIPTTITGAGVDQSSITGAGFPAINPDRLFHVIAGTVTFRDLTLTHGTGPNGSDGMDGVNGMNPVPPTNGMPGFNGGAIFNGADLLLDDVAVTNNAAGRGGKGGVGLTLNTGANGGPGGVGGGIYNVGTLALIDVTISGNHAGDGGIGGSGGAGGSGGTGGMGGCCGDGGGVDSAAAAVVITDSTFAQNHAGNGGAGGIGGSSVLGEMGTSGSGGSGAGGASGGGIAVTGGSAMITNSTFTANVSGLGGDGGDAPAGGHQGLGNGGNAGNGSTGGGLFIRGGATVTLANVTIADNQVSVAGTPGISLTGATAGAAGNPPFGGGVFTNGSPATNMTDLLLAGNGLGNCAGSTTDGGHNLSFGDASCPSTFTGGDPKLGALQDNGGPTPTMALGAGSAAIDGGAGCGTTDQRGVLRPVAACDIGAYEFALPAVSTGSPAAITATTAILEGSVLTNNASASFVFEFGKTNGYGSQAPVGGAITGLQSVPVAGPLTGLTPGTTYHYRLVATSPDGAATSPDATFTTALAPPGASSPTQAPELTHPSIAPSSFFAAPFRHHKTGTTITYTDSLAGRTTLVVFAQTTGVKLHGRCVKPPKHAHGPKCVRLVKLGSFSHSDRVGSNAVRFTGRLGGHKLPPGRYVLELTPQLAGETGKTVSLRCRVL